MARLQIDAANAALKESVSLLELMEHLLIGNDGRPHLAAMRFGGVTRLARRLTSFLNHGSIHRDESGAECCAKFLREIYRQENLNQKNIQENRSESNAQQSLMDPDIYNTKDIQQWIINKIVEATLHPALKLVATKMDNLDSTALILKNYESHSFMRQTEAVFRLVEGARPFDDQDSSRLAEIALFGSELYKNTDPSEFINQYHITQCSSSTVQLTLPENVVRSITKQSYSSSAVNVKSYSKNDNILLDEPHDISEPHLFSKQIGHEFGNMSSNKKAMPIYHHREASNYNCIQSAHRDIFHASHQYGSMESVEAPISSSCPGLTTIAFQRYLGKRKWNSESLHDEDELEVINTRNISKSLELLQTGYNEEKTESSFVEVPALDSVVQTRASKAENVTYLASKGSLKNIRSAQNIKPTGTRPKMKNLVLPCSGEASIERNQNNLTLIRNSSKFSKPPLPSHFYNDFHKCQLNENVQSNEQNAATYHTEDIRNDGKYRNSSTYLQKTNKVTIDLFPHHYKSNKLKTKKRGHRRTQSDTQALDRVKIFSNNATLEEHRILGLFPTPLRKSGSNTELENSSSVIQSQVIENFTMKLKSNSIKSEKFSTHLEGSINEPVRYELMRNSSLIDYIRSGAFSRQISCDLQNGHRRQGSQVLMADNAHIILAEALIQSGLSLISEYCKGSDDETYSISSLKTNNSINNNGIKNTAASTDSSEVNMSTDLSNSHRENECSAGHQTFSIEKPVVVRDENILLSNRDEKASENSGGNINCNSRKNDKLLTVGQAKNHTNKHIGMHSTSPKFYASLSNDSQGGSIGNEDPKSINQDIENTNTETSNALIENASSYNFRKHSAEATAIDLLNTLKDPYSLKASELAVLISKSQKILVSEEDAPQKLLPLPYHASMWYDGIMFDDSDTTSERSLVEDLSAKQLKNLVNTEYHKNILYNHDNGEQNENDLAASNDWEPPSTQLILNLHQKPRNAKDALKMQNYMCHDCGMRPSSPSLAIKGGFRFCYYFGKYSCSSCHSNQKHVIPSAIIYRWDFKEYPVSNFAHTVLSRVSMDPIFVVDELNPDLIQKIPKLRKALELRKQATEIAKYLVSCRIAAQDIKEEDYKECIIKDPRKLSLIELCLIRLGAYGKSLINHITFGMEHIVGKECDVSQKNNSKGCPLCFARGFICELCRSEDVIFPFQPELEVHQCKNCFACYHTKCYIEVQKTDSYNAILCQKCERIKYRQTQNVDLTAKDFSSVC